MKLIPRLFILLCTLAGTLFSCQNQQKPTQKPQTSLMQATILRKINLPDIPSASGLEVIGNQVYVIGDDSPFLYMLDLASLELKEKILLFENTFPAGIRIPKAFKPDLECLTTLNIDGAPHLLAFGSGSAPTRANCYTISLPGPGTPFKVSEKSLKALYSSLQRNESLLKGDLLNLEAAATNQDKLFLFQRSTQAGPNVILAFDTREFIRHLKQPTASLPAFQTLFFKLPRLNNLEARFSGAFTYDKLLFFTASVENTTNAILDGEVLGSFVGWINTADLITKDKPVNPATALIRNQQGEPYAGKVESLAIINSPEKNIYRCLAVTDDDNGQSELLELEIKL